MIDLSKIDDETLLARGAYSTIRAAHEDAKKELSILCGELSSTATKVLRQMQPGEDEIPTSVEVLIASGRATMDLIEACAKRIESLAAQKQGVRQQAWGRK